MKFGIYSIRDVKTNYMSPTFDVNDYSAIRNFENAVWRKDSLLNSHSSDFRLYKIGEFNSETGEVSSCVPVLLAEGEKVL